MWIKRGLQSAKSDASQLCPTNDFLYRQKIVDTMAESMDTSEILADEDDRKLFVGGLPQVWTLVDISRVLQNLLSNCKLSFVTSVRAGRLMFTLFRTPSRRIYRYIFRLLERLITLTSKLIQLLEDLGESYCLGKFIVIYFIFYFAGVLHLLCLRLFKDYRTLSPRQNMLSKARRLPSKKPKLKRVKSTSGN